MRPAALLLLLLLLGPAPAALGGSVDAKRGEAARLQARIDAQAEGVADLDRQVRSAQRQAGAAGAALEGARAQVAEADRRLAQTKRRLAGQAVEAYVSGSQVSVLEHMAGSDGRDLAVRTQYRKAAVADQREDLEDLEVVREDLAALRQRLRGAQRSASAAAGVLDARRQALEKGEGDLRSALARVHGELGDLLAKEQAERNALALRRAEAATRPPAPAPSAAPPASAAHVPPGGIMACIRQLESGNNYRAPGGGAYQIQPATWHSLGGTGRAEDADPATQDAMAIKLQQRSGWSQWTTAKRCGAYD